MPIVFDSVSVNAASGTELMLKALDQRIDQSLVERVSIGRAIMLFDQSKPKIYWTHNLPGQMRISEVSENIALHPSNRWKYVDNIVFVSEWQKQQYLKHYQFTDEDQRRFTVLGNAITPIRNHKKPDGKIKLIYMSVPERGLALLYDVFEKIAPKYNIELEVYSSYKIYGVPQVDIVHKQILDKVKSHPKIKYYGTVSNTKIHEALERCHIFAYPSTFLETSCISLIEAMSAKCICVHSDIGALPETAGGHTVMYPFTKNRAEHADLFQAQLEKAIGMIIEGQLDGLDEQKHYADVKYSWDKRIQEWDEYLRSICES